MAVMLLAMYSKRFYITDIGYSKRLMSFLKGLRNICQRLERPLLAQFYLFLYPLINSVSNCIKLEKDLHTCVYLSVFQRLIHINLQSTVLLFKFNVKFKKLNALNVYAASKQKKNIYIYLIKHSPWTFKQQFYQGIKNVDFKEIQSCCLRQMDHFNSFIIIQLSVLSSSVNNCHAVGESCRCSAI